MPFRCLWVAALPFAVACSSVNWASSVAQTDILQVPIVSYEDVAQAGAGGMIHGRMILVKVPPSYSPEHGYRVYIASAYRDTSYLIRGVPESELDAIWRGHDPEESTVWVVVSGRLEHPGRDFQIAPYRESAGELVNAQIEGWKYGAKHEFSERSPDQGK